MALSPCLSDEGDQPDCYWDAQAMGNGEGSSFVIQDGVLTYATDMPPGLWDSLVGSYVVVVPEPAPIADELAVTGIEDVSFSVLAIGIILLMVGVSFVLAFGGRKRRDRDAE